MSAYKSPAFMAFASVVLAAGGYGMFMMYNKYYTKTQDQKDDNNDLEYQ